MPFPVDSDVLVVALNRRGRVIDARGGVYRVLVGALTMTCREPELRAPEARAAGRKRKQAGPHAAPASAERHTPADAPVVRSIDLHGLTVEEARIAVTDFLSRAVMDGADTLEIVHGIGTGRLREAVRRELQAIAAVRRVRPHPTNPGVTIVHL